MSQTAIHSGDDGLRGDRRYKGSPLETCINCVTALTELSTLSVPRGRPGAGGPLKPGQEQPHHAIIPSSDKVGPSKMPGQCGMMEGERAGLQDAIAKIKFEKLKKLC